MQIALDLQNWFEGNPKVIKKGKHKTDAMIIIISLFLMTAESRPDPTSRKVNTKTLLKGEKGNFVNNFISKMEIASDSLSYF